MNVVDNLLARLDRVKVTGSSQWMACCPSHDDKTPSLSIRECDDGTILLHCFGGCPPTDVLAAVGLELRDLFPNNDNQFGNVPKRPRINGWDVLAILKHRISVCIIGMSDWLEYGSLAAEDIQELRQALLDIDRIIGEAYEIR